MFRVMRDLIVAHAISVTCAMSAMAQAVGTAPVQYTNPMGELLPWVFSPQMQKELEILDDQRQKLAKLQTDAMNETRGLYAKSQSEDRAEWMRKYNETANRLARETDKRVEEILLPHQLRRLRQVVLQTRLHGAGYGSSAGLTSAAVADELGLTDEQKRELKEKEKEITAEVQRKTREFYEQLREESEEELLSVLTEAQRRKLRELIGEKFDWQQQAKSPAGGAAKPNANAEKPREVGGKAAKP